LPRRWKPSIQCTGLQGGFPANHTQSRRAPNHSQRSCS
jgi:hypothetical protein